MDHQKVQVLPAHQRKKVSAMLRAIFAFVLFLPIIAPAAETYREG